jgi:16S rRNA (guanine527-N7)-methyltransferase
MPDTIFKYFPLLSDDKKEKIQKLKSVYTSWNNMINVISRKDMENFYIHHVLHSLSIAKIISFTPGTKVFDVGSGGGFPGIPLAVLFPETEFTLLDSIEKKIKVISSIAEDLGLKNVIPLRKRAEDEKGKYDFVVGRAVTGFPEFTRLIKKNISQKNINSFKNGIIYLKGGDIDSELSEFKGRYRIWNISDYFTESFFETKKIVYLPF